MMSEHSASGDWLAQSGSEDEFIERWREWLSTTSPGVAGFGSARLLRSIDDPRTIHLDL
jgi:heme-degrading monooxygenase HmoA